MTAPNQQNQGAPAAPPRQPAAPPVAPPPVPPNRTERRASASKNTTARERARDLARRANAPRKAVRDTITAAHGTLAVGGLEHVAHVPWPFPAAFGAVLLGAGTYWSNEVHSTPLFGATMGIGAGGWLTWAALDTPWDIPHLAALAVAATGAGTWYAKIRRMTRRARMEQQRVESRLDQQALSNTERVEVRDAWQAILAEADCRGAEVEQVKPLTDGASGFEIRGRLTSPKFDFKQLEGTLSAIELIADARTEYPIRPGSIRLKRPANGTAGQWVMTVPTVNIFGQAIPHQISHEPRSIEDPIEIATAADGSRVAVRHSDSPHAMFSGMTDFGKSNLLNCHIFEWTRCTDAVVWLMSGPDKAPKLLKPLLRPWLKGETPNPPFDRFAASKEESMYMLWDAIQGMGHRAGSGGLDDVSSKWNVTPETPRLIIGIEEAGDYLEDNTPVKMPDGKKYTFGYLLRWLIRKARSEAINLLMLTQGGTLDFWGDEGSGIKKQIVYRVAFKAQASSETNACLAGDTARVELGELGKGEIYVEQAGYNRPVLALADYMEEGDNPDEHVMNIAALRHHQYARALDDGTAAAMPYYRDRWTRPEQQEYLAGLMGMSVEAVTEPDTAPATGRSVSEFNTGNEAASDDTDDSEISTSDHEQRLNGLLERYRKEADDAALAALEADVQDTARTLGDLDPETLRVVGVLQKITEAEVAANDLRSRVATELGMDDSTETDRYINAAVKDLLGRDDLADVKQRKSRGDRKVTVWDMEPIAQAIRDMGRG